MGKTMKVFTGKIPENPCEKCTACEDTWVENNCKYYAQYEAYQGQMWLFSQMQEVDLDKLLLKYMEIELDMGDEGLELEMEKYTPFTQFIQQQEGKGELLG